MEFILVREWEWQPGFTVSSYLPHFSWHYLLNREKRGAQLVSSLCSRFPGISVLWLWGGCSHGWLPVPAGVSIADLAFSSPCFWWEACGDDTRELSTSRRQGIALCWDNILCDSLFLVAGRDCGGPSPVVLHWNCSHLLGQACRPPAQWLLLLLATRCSGPWTSMLCWPRSSDVTVTEPSAVMPPSEHANGTRTDRLGP